MAPSALLDVLHPSPRLTSNRHRDRIITERGKENPAKPEREKSMKILKSIAITIIITSLIMVSFAQAEDYPEFYPKLTVVVAIHTDTVICQDKKGNLWAFFSDEDEWAVGDICNLMMWNVSENIEEHEIVEVYWEGHTEDVDNFFQMIEWR